MKKSIILASRSPRRIELLNSQGLNPLVLPSDIEENLPLYNGMVETPMFIALKKGEAVMKMVKKSMQELSNARPIIIAADTIVFKDKIMGKPQDKEEGFEMLKSLRNSDHYVVTGVAMLQLGESHIESFVSVTKVCFTDYSDRELLSYLDTDEAYDKAGGYAIQGTFEKYVREIKGDYDNVVGLPVTEVMEKLARFE